jgi:hypothetical protein
MLIEFNVKNYRSLWESQSLSLTAAGAIKDLQEQNSFKAPIKGSLRLLRSAVIYGPNAAGKSNLIAALGFMQDFVLTSSKNRQEGDTIESAPFLFNSEGASTPTELEVFFIQDGVRYQYGFACTKNRIVNEWLFAYPGNRSQKWFERSYDPEKNKENWYFGSKFLGSKKTWQENTRSNALFLSTAVQLNSEQLKPIYMWFRKLVVIHHGFSIDPSFTVEHCQDEKHKEEIISLMKGADIDVDGIDVEEKKLSVDELELPGDMPPSIQRLLKDDLEGKLVRRVKINHLMTDTGQMVSLPLEAESDGTQKLFAYAAPWLDLIKNGRVLVVDELSNSFHPHMLCFLLSLVHDPESNQANGQLVFSTHDTSILDQKYFRRDQVWFVEKDGENTTQMYPLTDFRPRKGEALGKGYLNGRYGALPYFGEMNF